MNQNTIRKFQLLFRERKVKNSLLLKAMERKSKRIIKVDYDKTSIDYYRNSIMEKLRDVVFTITKTYGNFHTTVIGKTLSVGLEKDGQYYDKLNMIVEIKVVNTENFVRFNLDFTPFNCFVEIDSFIYDNIDVKEYFKLHKDECERSLSYRLKKLMKETFGKTYVKLYQNYRKKIMDNEALEISAKMMKEYEKIEKEYKRDIENIKSM